MRVTSREFSWSVRIEENKKGSSSEHWSLNHQVGLVFPLLHEPLTREMCCPMTVHPKIKEPSMPLIHLSLCLVDHLAQVGLVIEDPPQLPLLDRRVRDPIIFSLQNQKSLCQRTFSSTLVALDSQIYPWKNFHHRALSLFTSFFLLVFLILHFLAYTMRWDISILS